MCASCTYMSAPGEVEKVTEARCRDPFVCQITEIAETTELGAPSSRLVRFHDKLVVAGLRRVGNGGGHLVGKHAL